MTNPEEISQPINQEEEQTNIENHPENTEPEKTEIENSEQKQEEITSNNNVNEIKSESKRVSTTNNKVPVSKNPNQKKMKKQKTPLGYHYYDPKAIKFNKQKFDKQIDTFKEWERKRTEKLKNKQIEKQEKEYAEFTKKNIHYNKNTDNVDTADVINRLYQKDIKNRKEKQKTLIKVYEPPFRPNAYKGNYIKYGYVTSTIDNKNNLVTRNKRANNRSMGKRNLTNVNDVNKYRNQYNFNDEEEEDEEEGFGYNTVRDEEEIQDRFRQMLFFNKTKTIKAPETKKLNVSIGKRNKLRQTA